MNSKDRVLKNKLPIIHIIGQLNNARKIIECHNKKPGDL